MGWLLTINGYYDSRVKWIYDTDTRALTENPDRKFIRQDRNILFHV